MAIVLLTEVNYVYTSLYLQLLAIVHQLAPVFLMKVSRPSTRLLGKCKNFGFGTRLLFEGSGGRVTTYSKGNEVQYLYTLGRDQHSLHAHYRG